MQKTLLYTEGLGREFNPELDGSVEGCEQEGFVTEYIYIDNIIPPSVF